MLHYYLIGLHFTHIDASLIWVLGWLVIWCLGISSWVLVCCIVREPSSEREWTTTTQKGNLLGEDQGVGAASDRLGRGLCTSAPQPFH
jgi:hypothetical protein